MNINNSNMNSLSMQESWATHISDYILQRRQQTQSAYTSDQKTIVAQSSHESTAETTRSLNEDSLFRAFFILLANQLEEGHTVLTIRQTNNEPPILGYVNDDPIKLYDWQVKLLELLVAPLTDFIDSDELEAGANELLVFKVLTALKAKGEQLWWKASLNAAEKKLLEKRLELVLDVYKGFNGKSLKILSQQLFNHALFKDVSNNDSANYNIEHGVNDIQENSLSKSRNSKTPIILQIQSTKENSANQITLTLWLHRAWQAEYNLAQKINQILVSQIRPFDISLTDKLNEQQINAIHVANNNAFSIITGGPGTGKTYTVAELVMALQQAQDNNNQQSKEEERFPQKIRFSTDSASLALAAPTGKAAQRMQESLQAALDVANVDMQLQDAKTIHRLLGIGRTGKPRYNAENPLGEDIIIIDEASMLGVELANYLVSAVKPGARLILLGDANQLAAVDAGAVLADLCHIALLAPIHAELTESRRFSKDSGIGKLAHQINQEPVNPSMIWQLLEEDSALKFENIDISDDTHVQAMDTSSKNKITNSLSNKKQLSLLKPYYQNYVNKVKLLLETPINTSVHKTVKDIVSSLMVTFNEFRVLSAGHHGEWGDHFINNYLTQWHKTELKLPIRDDTWYHGRPVMVLQNNYELGLFNGDIGICLQTAGHKGRLEVFFENKTQGIAVNLLNEELVSTAYAMTIHKSQGSEFDHVAITLDSSHARLLSKELIYTAVTRAKKQVTIYSSKDSLEKAVATPTQRHTGLALQFG